MVTGVKLPESIFSFLMPILVALVVSVIFLFMHLKRLHERRRSAFRELPDLEPGEPAPGPAPIFERPPRWLALKTANLLKVQELLGLHNPTPCSWAEGLASSREHKLFISPPIQGWILVFGPGIPDPSDDVDKSFHLISRLSRELGQVQFYHANQVLGHHAWVRAHNGRILRAYAWAGETLWNQGSITIAEQMIGVQCLGYGEKAELNFNAKDSFSGNTEKVPMLASRWSLDPTSINDAAIRTESGIVGDFR